MSHGHRSERLGRLFRQEITKLLLERLRDPRLDGMTVTDVRASRDLSFATVYVRSVGDVEQGIEGLERASGFIRRELGRTLHLRKIPEFRFLADETIEHADRIEARLREISDGGASRT